ncbi:RNA-binding CRS1 / YhbY (CRM) domain protein [Euphorbia peplus]|nr:RNA-binding CRS1 / YhbY (CRM) domain protein [Euphorbia peplus]
MAAASVSSLSTTHALHRLLRPPPSPPSFFSRKISAAAFTVTVKPHFLKPTPFQNCCIGVNLFSSLSSRSFSTSSLHFSPNAAELLESEEEEDYDEDDDEDEDEDDDEDEDEDEDDDEVECEGDEISVDVRGEDESPKEGVKRDVLKVPKLSVKEKKELASYAHGLGKKLKSQLVGKSGFTDNVAISFVETLEANELLKIKIHRTCPGELEDVVQRLQEATGSVVVSQIGRTVIIYRPSISKMKAEEKKNQIRKVYVRKDSRFQPTSPRGQVERLTARGRRGSSRV